MPGAEELVELVTKEALENLRQTSVIPFWAGSRDVTPQESLKKLFAETRSDDRKIRQMLEKAAEQASGDSFQMQFRAESLNRFGHSVSDTLWIVLKEGYEWDDVIKDAWAGFESQNPWCLTDNALKILKWIQGPKNTGDFVPENRLGSQAFLLGTGSYSRIGSYVKEISLKTPHRVKMEKTGGWQGSYKLTLLDKEEEVGRDAHENPVFPYPMRKGDFEASRAYTRMLEDLVLEGEFDEDEKDCILFELHSRAELQRALPTVAADERSTPYELEAFFRDLQSPRGLRATASLKDEAGNGWLLGAQLEEGWTWERAKESIREARNRRNPVETYGLSVDAGKILNWIWNLHDSQMHMGMTPCVESASREKIGIKDLDYGQNSKAVLQLLVDEINQKTPFLLRLIPWRNYSSEEHRILMRPKDDLDAQITRMIQIRGLERNVALPVPTVEEALRNLWAIGIPLS